MFPQLKTDVVITPASYTNGATASGNVDTMGADFVTIDVFMSTSNDVTNNPSVLKISESDDTVVTNFADVTGLVGDTSFTIPNSVTAGDWAVKFNIDTRGRKRYLKLSVTPLTTQVIAAVANLGRQSVAATAATGDMKAIVTLP